MPKLVLKDSRAEGKRLTAGAGGAKWILRAGPRPVWVAVMRPEEVSQRNSVPAIAGDSLLQTGRCKDQRPTRPAEKRHHWQWCQVSARTAKTEILWVFATPIDGGKSSPAPSASPKTTSGPHAATAVIRTSAPSITPAMGRRGLVSVTCGGERVRSAQRMLRRSR